jgi:hypothetical protein
MGPPSVATTLLGYRSRPITGCLTGTHGSLSADPRVSSQTRPPAGLLRSHDVENIGMEYSPGKSCRTRPRVRPPPAPSRLAVMYGPSLGFSQPSFPWATLSPRPVSRTGFVVAGCQTAAVDGKRKFKACRRQKLRTWRKEGVEGM